MSISLEARVYGSRHESEEHQVDQVPEPQVLAVRRLLGHGMELLRDLVAKRETRDLLGSVEPEVGDPDGDGHHLNLVRLGSPDLDLERLPIAPAKAELS
jgi:hypothetical protein